MFDCSPMLSTQCFRVYHTVYDLNAILTVLLCTLPFRGPMPSSPFIAKNILYFCRSNDTFYHFPNLMLSSAVDASNAILSHSLKPGHLYCFRTQSIRQCIDTMLSCTVYTLMSFFLPLTILRLVFSPVNMPNSICIIQERSAISCRVYANS